jgi:hypothetical protein
MQLTTHKQMQDLIFSNGYNNPARIQFHEDPGHGWMQVPKKLLMQLGIDSKISGYSYETEFNAYLEEDCDMSILFQALGVSYTNQEAFKLFWSLVPRNHTNNRSLIRAYRNYEAPAQPAQTSQISLFMDNEDWYMAGEDKYLPLVPFYDFEEEEDQEQEIIDFDLQHQNKQ